jgi:hypothetical protein
MYTACSTHCSSYKLSDICAYSMHTTSIRSPFCSMLQLNAMCPRHAILTHVNAAVVVVVAIMMYHIQGIRIIKLFAWESNFINKIFSARATEIAILRVYMFTLGVFMVVVKSSPTLGKMHSNNMYVCICV